MFYTFLQYEAQTKIFLAILLIIVPASVFINKLFQDLFQEQGEVFAVDSIIGILERILVLIFAYHGQFAAFAIIITIKTWARTGDLKDEAGFRNKYLLGTLTSMVWAFVAFLIIR